MTSLITLQAELSQLIQQAQQGALMSRGARVVITAPPTQVKQLAQPFGQRRYRNCHRHSGHYPRRHSAVRIAQRCGGPIFRYRRYPHAADAIEQEVLRGREWK